MVKTIKISAHNHTTNSDGLFKPEQLLNILNKHYDVVAITDHRFLTKPKYIPPDLMFFYGVEYYLSHLGFEVLGLCPDLNNPTLASCEVAWVCHPKYIHCDLNRVIKFIQSVENVYGCEIYNQAEYQFDGWEYDWFNSYDNMNFYAVDDLHVMQNLKTSWMEMEVDSVDKHTVLENLKSGDFWIKTKH